MRERRDVTIVVDGHQITAPEGSMLVDAAKSGDIEIPVFCYEPKLGEPVGACRMCLVEVEGIPKLQTSCSTPVRDGMIVHTRTDRVKVAQNAVVEFLLVNHPLDCPVCDKGGECPLQDIAMGWGDGRSRMVDPKRHFEKPIPLSPLVKIDRERCILCYRCVRFSQEVSEDEQLQLLERGDSSYVGTFDDRPYVSAYHGNIIELCPVGALTSQEYRFRARPWDIEDAASICTICPSQCNTKLTVRDEQVIRAQARDNSEVDDGWLCDKGRFGYEMAASEDRPTSPKIRQGGALRDASWEEALDRIATELAGDPESGVPPKKLAVLTGGATSNEEGWLLQRIARNLGSDAIVAAEGPECAPESLVALGGPALSASMSELGEADAILVIGADPGQEMPIAELRIRKAVRRGGAMLAIATERPTGLENGPAVGTAGPVATLRYAPGQATTVIDGLVRSLASDDPLEAIAKILSAFGGRRPDEEIRAIAAALDGAERPVIVFGESILAGPGADAAADALLALATKLGLPETGGAGLIGIPAATNGRGLREVGCAAGLEPGMVVGGRARTAAEVREALEQRELDAVILWDTDPVRELPDSEGWSRALGAAPLVVSVSMFGTASATNADVHLPLEAPAEREGTITHPDGRLQRLRPGVPRPGAVRPLWHALTELAARLGDETGLGSCNEVTQAVAAAVPFYAGLDAEAIGAAGQRWCEREAAAAYPEATRRPNRAGSAPPAEADGDRIDPARAIALGTYRDLWADDVTERNPALRFLAPEQTLELAPADAERLGLAAGDGVSVRSNGHSVEAKVALRSRMREGAGFLARATAENNANVLAGADQAEVTPL